LKLTGFSIKFIKISSREINMKLLILIIIFTSINISCQVTTKEQLQKTEQLINERKYLEASAYLEEIISKDSLNQEAHYFLGQAYYKPLFVEGLKMVYLDLQIAKRASGHFKRAIEISPYYKGKVFVLGPYSKIQTIWGSMALNYILKGNPGSAKWALLYGQSEGGFVPAMLEYNKNIWRVVNRMQFYLQMVITILSQSGFCK